MQQQWCVKTQLSINTQTFKHLDRYVTCGNMPQFQKWPFPHSGSHSSLKKHTSPSSVPDSNFVQSQNYEKLLSATSQINQPVVVHLTIPTISADQSVQREHRIKTDLSRL